MRARIGIFLGCLTLLCGAATSRTEAAPGRGPSGITWAEGSRAAADTWTQEDGCSARTGATATLPWVGPREVAWRFTPAGEIEGEPLAWKGSVFVVARTGNKRTLHVLSTATGAERTRQVFDSPLPLAPCLLEGRIVLRATPRTLQGLSVGEKSLAVRWTVTGKAGVGPPTAVGDQVYVVVDGMLQRRAFGSSEPVWPKAGAKSVAVEGAAVAGAAAGKGGAPGGATEYPRPSVRGGSVYVATGARLVEADRDDGTFKREGKLAAAVDPKSVRVVVGLADVLVTSFAKAEGGADTSRVVLSDGSSLASGDPLSIPFGVASVGRDWVGLVAKDAKGLALLQLPGTSSEVGEDHEMANGSRQAWFLDTKVPPTTAGDLVLIGGKIYDAESRAVLRLDTIPCVSRAIPVRDRLLVAETKTKLVAWKSPVARPVVAPLRLFPGEGVAAGTPVAGRVALDDGRTVAGNLATDPKTGGLAVPGKPPAPAVVPLTAVRAFLADGDAPRLLLANAPGDAADAVAALARVQVAPTLLALVPDAVASGDGALARKVQDAAADRGAAPADLAKTEPSVAALEAKSAERDESKVADVEGRLRELLAGEADVLVAVADSLPATAPLAWSLALVRAAADRSPYHSGATAWVRGRLPEGMSPKGMTDLLEWLDFLETLAGDDRIRVYAPGSKGRTDAPQAVADALAEVRASWRDDLVGFQNGHLLVISPPIQPRAITRCLSLGRVVCDELDADFASIGPRLVEDEVLVSLLFPSKTEYVKESTKGLDDPSAAIARLENTAGHYSPGQNVTRIFFPVGDDGEDVLRTYAHELTHHWVARRRPPRTQGEELGDRAGGPGYFIVEGIADFVKDWNYEAPGGKPARQNASANYADIVAALPADAVVPWERILGMSQQQAYALPAETKEKIVLRWHLGAGNKMRRVGVYYAQSAALTAYLFLAEGGKHRPALYTHLYDHYAGECDPGKILAACGCTAEELGARVVAWCKATGSPLAPTGKTVTPKPAGGK